MNELQNVTDINEVIKYAEREAEGCHQMASAYHTDEGVYLQEETRCQYKAILWENIHEWLEELKELRKKQRPRGEWLRGSLWSEGCGMGEQYGYYYTCSVCGHEFKGGYTKCNVQFCSKCGSDNLPEGDDEK